MVDYFEMCAAIGQSRSNPQATKEESAMLIGRKPAISARFQTAILNSFSSAECTLYLFETYFPRGDWRLATQETLANLFSASAGHN